MSTNYQVSCGRTTIDEKLSCPVWNTQYLTNLDVEFGVFPFDKNLAVKNSLLKLGLISLGKNLSK